MHVRRRRNAVALARFASRSDGTRSLPGESAAELNDQREQRGQNGSASSVDAPYRPTP